jgi:putative membrane-bound dehydrogenase-like protein
MNPKVCRHLALVCLTGVALSSWGADAPKKKGGPDAAEKARREAVQEQRAKDVAEAATHPFGRAAAEADLKKLTVGAGLEATLFAAEPLVVNPADMDVDHKGRVWITEGANYRISPRMNKTWGEQRKGGDRITILEDTNGDGAADKVQVFYQDPTVNAALGICVLGNKVIVSSSPNVFVLTDTDGDGKADKRELLFEDNSQGDHDHCMHAFVFGPDGKLYFNFGNEVKELRRPVGLKNLPLNGPVPKHDSEIVVDLAGNKVTGEGKPYRQGMVFRCNLDGSEVETVAWNFRNNYEVAVDSFGTLWQSDNDDDGNKGVRINFVMEFGNYGFKDEITGAAWKDKRTNLEKEIPLQHWHLNDPGVVPNLLQTGQGSPTGMAIYEGKLLPEVFRGQPIHCDAGPRVVRAYPTKAAGAGYSAVMLNILTTEENWFRPSDVCVAPDGSLYAADWNDAGVGGHNMADRKLETMTGRVFRVAPPGSKASVPALDLTSAAGCAAALQSPNQATRYLAWTKLHEMQGKARGELTKLWNGKDQIMRARALQLLARIKGNEKKQVESALKDKNSDIRIAGLRIARELKLDVIPYVKQLVKDGSPQVRRECAIALRHQTSPQAADLWAQLARQHDGQDRWYLEALGIGADRQEAKFFEAWLKLVGDKWNTPAGRDIVWRSRAANVPPYIVKIVTDPKTTEDEKPRYLRALDFIKGPEKETALIEIATSGLK